MTIHRPTSQTAAPRAFSLIEVLLVLAVLALIAAVSYPSLTGAFERHRLRRAADQVRIQLQQARIQAIRSNCCCAFCYVPGGRQYVVQVLGEVETLVDPSSGQVLGVADPAAPSAPEGESQRLCGRLPEGVRFVQPRGTENTPAGLNNSADAALSLPESLGAELPLVDQDEGTGTWSWPICFYPDGTADSASVWLENEKGRRMEVRLRGLTGVVTVGSLSAAEEVLP